MRKKKVRELKNGGGVGSEAERLSVNTSAALANKKQVLGITLTNSGSDPITIDKIIVNLSGSPAINLNFVTINSSLVWSGSALLGSTVDITNTILTAAHGAYNLNSLEFSKNIAGYILSIDFIMSDSSVKSVTGISL